MTEAPAIPDVVVAARVEARRELWRRGLARTYLLDESGPTGGQQAWLGLLDAIPPGGWAAWEVSRQRGKTFAALSWVGERCGLRPNTTAVYLAQTGGNADAIVRAWWRVVEPEIPPEWEVRWGDGYLRFGNGSELVWFGTDNDQFRRRRGRAADIVLLDESGFYADLLAVEQVYVPQLQTTHGVGVYLSSPALVPTHPFSARCDALAAVGRYVSDTFWSNPRINHEEVIRAECERLGMSRDELLASTYFRREYLAQRVAEETAVALPAWTAERISVLVGDWERPVHFDAYESLDPGKTGDPHAWLGAFYDPETRTVTVEDELELRSAAVHIAMWAEAIKKREATLWGVSRWDGTLLGSRAMERRLLEVPEYLRGSVSEAAPRQPYLRVGDNEGDTLAELAQSHGLSVWPTDKHDKSFHVDFTNQLIREGRLRVHRRCRRLLEQMSGTLWNRTRTAWVRSDRDHGDLLDCLVYLLRNIDWVRDCRPPPPADLFLRPPAEAGWDVAWRRAKR